MSKKRYHLIDSNSETDENSNLANKATKKKTIIKSSSEDDDRKEFVNYKEKIKKKKKKCIKDDEDEGKDNHEDLDYFNEFEDNESSNSSSSSSNLTNVELALRESVLSFFNNISISEMQSLIPLSVKRSNSLIELRPFKDYKDLV